MTTIIIIIIAVVVWVVCALINYGWSLAYFQREFELVAEDRYSSDKRYSLRSSCLGPVGLFISMIVFRPYHGLMFFKERKLTMNDFLMPETE